MLNSLLIYSNIESGRLFVWGENRYGQLGIGGQHTSSNTNTNTNNNNNNNNNNNSNGDIIIKPTCVKSLKTLGLKVADISFGNDWSVILTGKLFAFVFVVRMYSYNNIIFVILFNTSSTYLYLYYCLQYQMNYFSLAVIYLPAKLTYQRILQQQQLMGKHVKLYENPFVWKSSMTVCRIARKLKTL